jgi:hypothetical protein
MIPTRDLKAIGRARLQDAQVLLRARRFDGASYLCGYAVELALKARICRTLKWAGFPESGSEVKGMQSVRTHDLDILLRFSGIEARVRAKRPAEWSVVLGWSPERRYQAVGLSSAQETTDMIESVRRLLELL